MYLLKKIIQLREHSHPDHEKPFLEHLEDLRTMITRIVITLVVSMVICFGFQKQMMEVLRRPVEQVWITQLQAKLPQTPEQAPRPLGVEMWEKAKAIEHAAAGLDPAQALAATNDPSIKERLKNETQAAIERGVFGSPYVIVDDEPFWGMDRFDQIERWLARGGF